MLRWPELYNIEAPHLQAALEASEKAEVELNLLNHASKSFARDRTQKIAQGLRNAIYKCRPGSLFVKALQRIADLLDKGRRISQFFTEYFAHGEKLSRISPRSLRALPQCGVRGSSIGISLPD